MCLKKVTISFLIISIISCSKVPVTGRRQVNMLPESTLLSMSLTNYQQFLSENKKLSSADSRTVQVRSIGKKIQDAVTQYMKKEGLSKKLEGFQWEFNVVEDPLVNAWCMPGGKVVVYTGLLPVTQTDEGLATVMGHEIAHAVARHGNERMSQQLMVALGGIGIAVAMQEKPQQTQNIFLASYGAASTLGVLKYSRTHESEADKMGLIFMAMAGYNPSKSVEFWQRMSKAGGANMPEFMSTHPSDETRIKDIQAFLPEAMNYYKASTKSK